MLLKKLKTQAVDFLRDESGATAIEYALVASGLSMLVIASIQGAATETGATFDSVAGSLAANNTVP